MNPSINTDDTRIQELKELLPPATLINLLPCTNQAAHTVHQTRQSIHRILNGMEDRLLVIIGPCSIHDMESALEYAQKLNKLRQHYVQDLLIVMRVYFEKPRTTVGWKGLINDPYLDNSFKINDGLKIARDLLCKLNAMDMPAATEFLDVISPQYIGDLIAWGAIGARTTESQIHRELASGLSCPVGFKNGTDGNAKIAIDAIKAASQPHHFLSVTKSGHSAIVATRGNEDCHIILRGGSKQTNYDSESVNHIAQDLAKANLPAHLMIDCSHANSQKQHRNQIKVCESIAQQLKQGEERITGVMIESHLIEGRQEHLCGDDVSQLVYGQSITDACIGWEHTEEVLAILAKAVHARRIFKQNND